ncbi:MAG: ABC transporter ATP-binding protein [Chitinophagaceae bacterium]|nr:ABC transporter ATP-binding protein [Bacteroidota bacterium]MCC6258895.1 ABC transporter ATP-binding protein [Chitinophagaceae bacterium]MCW5917433.1 ABC transporter ATP-binding protein [Ferruginibacter sp.]
MTNAIAISNLRFYYPGHSVSVFENLNLNIKTGSRFGIFGPNGAGKTTLIACITGILKYSHGSIKINGIEVSENPHEIKKHFGYVPQDFSFYPELSPMENLMFFGAWAGLSKSTTQKRAAEILEVLGLSEVKDKPVRKFSGGMKRRVNLAIGVIQQPAILFLDEPTVGVDIHSRQALISYLKMLNTNGTTLMYTSHQLSEAEELCDEVALFDEGKIKVQGLLSPLLQQHQQNGLEGLFMELTGKKYRDS